MSFGDERSAIHFLGFSQDMASLIGEIRRICVIMGNITTGVEWYNYKMSLERVNMLESMDRISQTHPFPKLHWPASDTFLPLGSDSELHEDSTTPK